MRTGCSSLSKKLVFTPWLSSSCRNSLVVRLFPDQCSSPTRSCFFVIPASSCHGSRQVPALTLPHPSAPFLSAVPNTGGRSQDRWWAVVWTVLTPRCCSKWRYQIRRVQKSGSNQRQCVLGYIFCVESQGKASLACVFVRSEHDVVQSPRPRSAYSMHSRSSQRFH